MIKLQIFMTKNFSKVGSNYTCLAVIKIYFITKKEENCYRPVFSKECKYIQKEKKLLEILLKI